jgi:UDP-N-acetylglucosamine 2-epimerase
MRDSTERPELLETNSMILSGTSKESILQAFAAATELPIGRIPDDYRDGDVSDKIVKLLLKKL